MIAAHVRCDDTGTVVEYHAHSLRRNSGRMRCQNDIWQRFQFRIRIKRLYLESVQRSTGDFAGAQRICQIMFVDDVAAARIDDIHAVLHQINDVLADKVLHGLDCGQMQTDNISGAHGGFQIDDFYTQRVGSLIIRIRVIRNDLDREHAEQLGKFTAVPSSV